MTILSKANLAVVGVASGKEFDGGLNGVRVEPDGCTVGSNGRMIVAVEPVDEGSVTVRDVGEQVEPGASGLVLEKGFVEDVAKNLPRVGKGGVGGKGGVANVAVMTKCTKDPGKVQLTTVGKNGVVKDMARRPKAGRYPNWMASVRSARGKKVQARVAVSRKELITVLAAIDKAAPDPGKELPIFIEVGEHGMVLRAAERLTGQRIIGVLGIVHAGEEDWPAYRGWEQGVFGEDSLGGKRSVKRLA